MSDARRPGTTTADSAPGDEIAEAATSARGIRGYLIGLRWPSLLTVGLVLGRPARGLIWAPGDPDRAGRRSPSRRWACTSCSSCTSPPAPDNTNNVLALAFGVLIVFLVIGGSLWIMANLNHNMMPMDQIMQMQR